MTPRLEISISKIAHNAKVLCDLYALKGIELIGITKVVCGNVLIAKALVESGIKTLGDSRIVNIERMKKANVKAEFLLLRSPLISELKDVVYYADISLNSELFIIKAISKVAEKLKRVHRIILMVELGDLREGVMPKDVDDYVKEILKLKGVKMVGLGTNLACFGGVRPDNDKMKELSELTAQIEKKYKLELKYVSGGNSANYNWLTSTDSQHRINNLRVGESIFLGCESIDREPIAGLFTDAFKLVAEVIESKKKPSVPYGDICQNSEGTTVVFENLGEMQRVIFALGHQDVKVAGLTPLLDVEIIGASSDHLIVNAQEEIFNIGGETGFRLNYSALLAAMVSPYVEKQIN